MVGMKNLAYIDGQNLHMGTKIADLPWNVESDIIFSVMDKIHSHADFERIVMVSGDGDYKMLVDHLIKNKKFEKILFPNKKFASSLYNSIGSEYFDYLENIRKAIE